MSTLDIGIILFIIFWGVRGFFRGLTSEIISLIVWISSIYLSIIYFDVLSGLINDYVSSEQVSSIIAIIFIFIFTFMIAVFLGFISTKLVKIIGLNNYNKVLGLIFGSLKALSLLLFFTFMVNQTDLQNFYMMQDSHFIPLFNDFLDKYVQTGDSLFDSFELKI